MRDTGLNPSQSFAFPVGLARFTSFACIDLEGTLTLNSIDSPFAGRKPMFF